MTRISHKRIVEHLWRALRALILLIATGLWIYWPDVPKLLLMFLFVNALIIDQFKGYIENKIEDFLHWQRDFDSWD